VASRTRFSRVRLIRAGVFFVVLLPLSVFLGVMNADPEGILFRGTRIDLGSAAINGLAAFLFCLPWMLAIANPSGGRGGADRPARPASSRSASA